MGLDYLCFSTVESLRCSGISQIQRISLLVPPTAHALFALVLAKSLLGHPKDQKNSLLVIEGLLSFALSVGDFALNESSRSIAEGSTPLHTFGLVDFVIGALSLSFAISVLTDLRRGDIAYPFVLLHRIHSSPPQCFRLPFHLDHYPHPCTHWVVCLRPDIHYN